MAKPKRCCYYCEQLWLVTGRDRLRGLCKKYGVTMDAEFGLCDDFHEKTICLEWLKQYRAELAKMTPEERYASAADDGPITGGILFKA